MIAESVAPRREQVVQDPSRVTCPGCCREGAIPDACVTDRAGGGVDRAVVGDLHLDPADPIGAVRDAAELLRIQPQCHDRAVGVAQLLLDDLGVARPVQIIQQLAAATVCRDAHHAHIDGKGTANRDLVVALILVSRAAADCVIDHGGVTTAVVLHPDLQVHAGAVDVALIREPLKTRHGDRHSNSVHVAVGDRARQR